MYRVELSGLLRVELPRTKLDRCLNSGRDDETTRAELKPISSNTNTFSGTDKKTNSAVCLFRQTPYSYKSRTVTTASPSSCVIML